MNKALSFSPWRRFSHLSLLFLPHEDPLGGSTDKDPLGCSTIRMRKQARLLRRGPLGTRLLRRGRGEERDGVTHYSYGEGPFSRACLRIITELPI